MAKMFQKILAGMLALTLCASQLLIPVCAVTEPDSTVTTSAVEGGTQTVTITIDSNGNQTTTTEVNTQNPKTGEVSQSTTTEVITTSGDNTQTKVDTNWTSTTTQTGTDTQSGNPSVQTDTNVTTTVTGSENTTETNTFDPNTNISTIEGSIQGQETTTVTDTTVTTTTTTGVLFSDEDTSKTDETTTSSEENSTTGWKQGDVAEGQWTEGNVQNGNTLTTTNETSKTTQINAHNPGQVILELTPGSTTTEEVDVTIDQVLAGMEIPEGAVAVIRDGEVIGYKVTKTTVTSTPDPDPTVGDTTEILGSVIQTPTAPTGYTEGKVTDGNVTTVTEAILDDSGNIIGYRVTKTTVTEDNTSATTESTRETTTTSTGETVQTLPERPRESQTWNDDGTMTKTVVEDILEGDKVVGYKCTTTYYDSNGETMGTETNSIYGTTASSNTQVVRDPETQVQTVKTTTTQTEVNEIYTTVSTREATLVTERTNNITTTILTEEDTYQLVETEDGMYFLYQGTMQKVVALEGHGNVALTGLTPTATATSSNDLASKTSITSPPKIVNPGAPGSDQFKYVDYGLISDFRVTKANGGNTSEVHLYKLVDQEGNAYYAYCADLDTTAYRNTIYDISNANDVNYYQNNQDQDAYAHLLTIAINGYWGTSNDTGSMSSIKALLSKEENKAYLRQCGYTDTQITEIINSITDGEAMTATQAAIWTFGNKSSSNLVNTSGPANNVADANSQRNIEALYSLLISDQLKAATPNNETDIINEQDLTGATLELKGKVTDDDGSVVTDSDGNEKYNADLTFTLSVEESALTGNLKVVVTDQSGNKLCDDIQLLTENSNFLGKALADGSGYSYTIEDLELAEGVTVNLTLEGYQNLKKGVYIYTAATGSHEDSQTFIGIAEGTRDVNLSTSLSFTVEDPQLEHVDKSTTQTRSDTRVDRKEDHRTDTKTDTHKESRITITVVADTNVKTYGTQTETETKQEVTKESRSWQSQWKYALQQISDEDGNDDDDDDGGTKTPEDGEKTPLDALLEILDEDVPLAKAPKTGDISSIWAIISGMALGGMALLNRKRKDEE